MRLKSFVLILIITLTYALFTFALPQQHDGLIAEKVGSKDSVLVQQIMGATPRAPRAAAWGASQSAEKIARVQKSNQADRSAVSIHPGGLDSKAEIFYSNAPMHIGESFEKDASGNPTSTVKTSIFVVGTVKFDAAAEISQQGELSLTGDFVAIDRRYSGAVNAANKPLFYYTGNDYGEDNQYTPMRAKLNDSKGAVKFMGEWNKQMILREFSVTAGDPSVSQRLGSVAEGGYYANNRITMINFPKIIVAKDFLRSANTGEIVLPSMPVGKEYDVEKMGYVSIEANTFVTAKTLEIKDANRLSVQVISKGLENKIIRGSESTNDEYYALHHGYFDVEKIDAGGFIGLGSSEVDMILYKTTTEKPSEGTDTDDDDYIKTNTFTLTTTGIYDFELDKNRAVFLRGMTSPFEDLRSDHMFYHVLTKPSQTSITSHLGPVASPEMLLERGIGYFYGMDVSTRHFDEIATNWAHPADGYKHRERGGYNLSRFVREVKYATLDAGQPEHKGYNLFRIAKGSENKPGFQKFNTGKIEVKVSGAGAEGVAKGLGANFLGNPYMSPININGILGTRDANGKLVKPSLVQTDLQKPFLAQGFEKLHVVHDITPGISASVPAGEVLARPAYWVPTSGLVAYGTHHGLPVYAYNVNYDYLNIGLQGGTNSPEHFIEPMQMFVLQVAQGGTITFTDDLKTFAGSPFPTKLRVENDLTRRRNARANVYDDSEDSVLGIDIPDWFVLEATATNKNNEQTTDRTAVRFFEMTSATADLDSKHDIEKNISDPEKLPEALKASLFVKSIAADTEEKTSVSNVLYTLAANGTALLSNGLDYKTKEVPLYYIPGNESEEVTISAFGVENFQRIEEAWLIDHLLEKEVRLDKEGVEYSFTSYPDSESVSAENRFTLRFGKDDGEGPVIPTDNPITCYYSGSTLHIGGLNSADVGSIVQIFDLQGRLMGNTTINTYPSMEYRKALGQGTFIVRISGNRNYTTKFVNIHNY